MPFKEKKRAPLPIALALVPEPTSPADDQELSDDSDDELYSAWPDNGSHGVPRHNDPPAIPEGMAPPNESDGEKSPLGDAGTAPQELQHSTRATTGYHPNRFRHPKSLADRVRELV